MNNLRIELTGGQGVAFFWAILVLIFLLAWVVPAVRRKIDVSGGELLTIRAISIFSNGWLYYSEIFCRVTVYEKKFVWCYMLSNSHNYSDIKIEKPYRKGDFFMKISINGVSAILIGRAEGLARLAERIKL